MSWGRRGLKVTAVDIMADHEDPVLVDPSDTKSSEGDSAQDAPTSDPNGLEATEMVDVPAAPAGPPPIAQLNGVVKRYGDHPALGPLTLTLDRGCIGLLGPNGAGKSTLIRLMMGLLRPTNGTVTVLGDEVDPSDHAGRRRIGYVPEGDSRFPGQTGVQAVQFAARLVGMAPAAAVERSHQVLDYVGLGEARYRDADSYSTGMRQRLKIAQALVHDPELLILDEPTEGVDPEAREQILTLIGELVRDHDMQLLLSTHLLHDVERIATHAIILNKGRVVENGPVHALKTGARRGYQLRVDGDSTKLVERLQAGGVTAEWMGNALRVGTDDPTWLLSEVKACGLVMRHIAPVELSLNEIYEAAIARAPLENTGAAGDEADVADHENAADAASNQTATSAPDDKQNEVA